MSPEHLLLCDTSLQNVHLAITSAGLAHDISDRETILWRSTSAARSTAEMSENIKTGLREVDISYQELAGMIVSVGPGSFTGIKVGLAFVYGLMDALPALQVCPLSALEVAACQLGESSGGSGVVLLSRSTKSHGFFAAWQRGQERVRKSPGGGRTSGLVALADDWRGQEFSEFAGIYQGSSQPAYLLATPWDELELRLADERCDFRALSPPELSDAIIYGMAKEGARLWPSEFSRDRPQARYDRLSTAEEKREQRLREER